MECEQTMKSTDTGMGSHRRNALPPASSVDSLPLFVVLFCYHPYRFDGRVETAQLGGLCLCME